MIKLTKLTYLFFLIFPCLIKAQTTKENQIYLINSVNKEITLAVEVADNYVTRSNGLMYRNSMTEGTGFLLVYPIKGHALVWMKNTYIPLDLVFLSNKGKVEKIIRNARPFSTKIYQGTANTLAVLELNAGDISKFKISINSIIKYDHLLDN